MERHREQNGRLRQEDRRDPGRWGALAAHQALAFAVFVRALAVRRRVARLVGVFGFLAFAAQLFEALADHLEIVGGARPVHLNPLNMAQPRRPFGCIM
jgi:hypothetical protein